MRIVFLTLLAAGCASGGDPGSNALALSWRSAGGSQIRFDSFADADHTITVRFAPQYPAAAVQAVIGENGGGTFLLGTVWQESPPGARMVLNVASEAVLFDAELPADTWIAAALVGRHVGQELVYDVYVDGVRLEPSLTVSSSDLELPTGTLNLGQRTTAAPGPARQFYGLIDDLAVYDHALEEEDLVERMDPEWGIRSRDAGLLHTMTFESGTDLPESALITSGPAAVVEVEGHMTSIPPSAYVLPTNDVDMLLPFEAGVAWRVVRGFADPSTPHRGTVAFGLDFEVDGMPPTGTYPDGTSGAPILASAGGTVLTADDLRPSSATIPNVIEVRQHDAEFARYQHLAQGGSRVAPTEVVAQNHQLATASDVGSPTPMIHIEVGTHPMDLEVGVTFPVPFVDYERLDGGTWVPVDRGVPTVGDVIRRSGSR